VKLPPGAQTILSAIVAGTYRGGNDLRRLDPLERRGLIVYQSRENTFADKYNFSMAGKGITVTQQGIDWVKSDPRSMEWVTSHPGPSNMLVSA
jgi:hypothetical protein